MTTLYVDPKTFDQTCLACQVPTGSPAPFPGWILISEFREMREQARLSQVMEKETTYVTCRFCGSDNVVKDGVRNGAQYYWCKACKRKFSGNKALPGMRVPPDQIATAITLFYEGLSFDEIGRSVEQIHEGTHPSASTIYEWVARFTKEAMAKIKGYKAHTGPTWAADETVLDVAGGRTKKGSENTIWFWDVIDLDTRFLLGSHLSWSRTIFDARKLFTHAGQRAVSPPKRIITDKLAAYIDGIERVFGSEAVHVQSEGMASETHNNYIERFHSTLKQRTKVMRGMKNLETARLLLDGWLIHYNYFRPHESLNMTPAQAARINLPFRSWKDIVTDGVSRS